MHTKSIIRLLTPDTKHGIARYAIDDCAATAGFEDDDEILTQLKQPDIEKHTLTVFAKHKRLAKQWQTRLIDQHAAAYANLGFNVTAEAATNDDGSLIAATDADSGQKRFFMKTGALSATWTKTSFRLLNHQDATARNSP